MKLVFKSTAGMVEYHGYRLDIKDGEILVISDEERAKGLLKDFPENFKVLSEKEEKKKIFGSKKTK